MKTNVSKLTTILLSLAVLLTLSVFIFSLVAVLTAKKKVSYDYDANAEYVSTFNQKLTVIGDRNFAPFSYIGEDGKPAGSAVEMLYEIAKHSGYDISLTLVDSDVMQREYITNNYDLILNATYTKDSSSNKSYSLSYSADSCYVFRKKGSKEDSPLGYYKIATVKGSNARDYYVMPNDDGERFIEYASLTKALKAVSDGKCTYAIAWYSPSVQIIRNQNLDIVADDNEIYKENFYFCSPSGNDHLISKLNDSIQDLSKKGTVDKINNKWLETLNRSLTVSEFFKSNVGLVLICIFVILVVAATILNIGLKYTSNIGVDKETGLYNQEGFIKRCEAIIEENSDTEFIILRSGDSRFRTIKSNFGEFVAKDVVKAMKNLIMDTCSKYSEKYCIGYFGKDEFAVLLPKHTFHIEVLRENVRDCIENAVENYPLHMNFGICDVPNEKPNILECCENAAVAMHSIANEYNKFCAVYDKSLDDQQKSEDTILSTMKDSLIHGDFKVYYQPQYDYVTGKLCGAEALVRWIHPTLGFISPADFIPVFERNGFIYELDKYVWNKACEDLKEMHNRGIAIPHVSVNISRKDVYHLDIQSYISSIVDKNGLEPKNLRLELTESSYINDQDAMLDFIKSMQARGFFVEMDDFGSGYSSLKALKDAPFNLIKLDMDFLRENAVSERSNTIISSIVEMITKLKMDVIAEGVETDDQAQYLKNVGCYLMQGYYFSKPLPYSEFFDVAMQQLNNIQ